MDVLVVRMHTDAPIRAGGALPSITVSGTVAPTYDGVLFFEGQVFNDDDQSFTGNFDQLSVPVIADTNLTVSISDTDATFPSDQPGSYTVVVANVGTTASAGETRVDFHVPFANFEHRGHCADWACWLRLGVQPRLRRMHARR